MPDYWDSGIMVRQPSWHRKENAVFPTWPGFETARVAAGLTWEPIARPIALGEPITLSETASFVNWEQDPDYIAVCRNDREGLKGRLAVQPISYAIIGNEELGEIVEQAIGIVGETEDDEVSGEALFSIQEGRQVVCLLKFKTPLAIVSDPSQNYRYVSFSSRHDGNGGLRIRLTNVREQCANTVHASEMAARKNRSGYTIRHTANWQVRLDEVKLALRGARRDSKAWEVLANRLGAIKIRNAQRERYLERFIPTSTAMSDREIRNAEQARNTVRTILAGPSCKDISDTAYGLVMASTEYADHYRRFNSIDTYIGRQLLADQPLKSRAIAEASRVAGIGTKDVQKMLAEA